MSFKIKYKEFVYFGVFKNKEFVGVIAPVVINAEENVDWILINTIEYKTWLQQQKKKNNC